MKIRLKKSPQTTGLSTVLKTTAIPPVEVVVHFDDDSYHSDSLRVEDLEVLIGEEWKSLSEAFRNRDVITDGLNTIFFEPTNDIDRQRGYTL